MISTISPEDAETFSRDGIICLRQIIDLTWVDELQNLADEMLNTDNHHPEQSQELAKNVDSGRFSMRCLFGHVTKGSSACSSPHQLQP